MIEATAAAPDAGSCGGEAGWGFPDVALVDRTYVGGPVLGASVRGRRHVERGEPRQDHIAVAVCRPDSGRAASGTVIVAVADGASASRLSHLSAHLACTAALGYLAKAPDPPDAGAAVVSPAAGRHRGVTRGEGQAGGENVGDGVTGAVARHLRRMLLHGGRSPEDVATTLTTGVLRAATDGALDVTLTFVGDSPAYVLDPDDDPVWTRLDDPGPVVVAGDLLEHWLPGAPVARSAHVTVPAGAALLVVSDGVGNQLGDGDNQYADHLVACVRNRELTAWSFAAWVANRSPAWRDDQSGILVPNYIGDGVGDP